MGRGGGENFLAPKIMTNIDFMFLKEISVIKFKRNSPKRNFDKKEILMWNKARNFDPLQKFLVKLKTSNYKLYFTENIE